MKAWLALPVALLSSAPAAALPPELLHDRPLVTVAVNGRPTVALLDSAAEILIGADYSRRIGLTGRWIVAHEEGGGLGGARRRDIVVLRSLTLAGRTFRNVRAAIDPGETASDLNIGTSILRHFLIIADFPRRTIWLEPHS